MTLSNPFSGTRNLGYDDILVKYMGGDAEWQVGDVFDVGCDINVLKYPFDQQTCSIKFVAGSYTSQKIRFGKKNPRAQLQFYSENPEWELLETNIDFITEGGIPGIELKIRIKRRYEFFLINIFCPILLLTFLSTMVFFLPVDSGERIGYSVSCLLSIMVYLTVMAETLPRTSNPVPFLAIFLLFDLFLSTMICVGAIVGLQFYHKEEKESVPRWIQYLLTRHCRKCEQSSKVNNLDKDSGSDSSDHSKSRASIQNILIVAKEKPHEPHDDEVHIRDENDNGKLQMISWKDVGHSFDSFCFISGNVSVVLLMSIYLLFTAT